MFRNAHRSRRHRNSATQEEQQAATQPFFSKTTSQAVQQKPAATFFQARLAVNQPNDKYEKEADTVADAVVSNQAATPVVQQKEISSIQRLSTPIEEEKLGTNDARMLRDKEIQEKPEIQRMCPDCEKEKKEGVQRMSMPAEDKKEEGMIQHKADGTTATASTSLSGHIENSAGSGKSLPAKTLHEMQSSFGIDFSGVNIHTDTEAVQMNKELNAQAFTHGSDIYFNNGKYNPETSGGKRLLAHELTHVVQQGAIDRDSIQRSCHDGACDSCFGGVRDFWITFYFRRKATRKTMTYLRQQINEAKAILANCCLRLKAEFNWTLLPGGGTFNFLDTNPDGSWNYSADASALGTGNTFADSRGIPVLVVDDVPASGGGVTVDTRFDAAYQGRTYAVIGVNQTNPNPGCSHLAHELWHVASGIVGHDVAHGTLAACTGNTVGQEYCVGLRNIVAPVGDFPVPARGDTAIA